MCTEKCIECVWPQGKERLPREYKIPPKSANLVKQRKQSRVMEHKWFHEAAPSIAEIFKDAGAKISSVLPEEENYISAPFHFEDDSSNYSTEYEVLDTESTVASLSPFEELETPEIAFMKIPKPISLANSQKFLEACVNGFIVSLGPQHTHPLLTTSATFSPFVTRNRIMEQVAESCGCSFLSWLNPELTELSLNKHNNAVDTLMQYVNSKAITKQDESWVGAAFQMMCLCAKITWGCDRRAGLRNLRNSYRLIKHKLERRETMMIHELQTAGPQHQLHGLFDDSMGDNLKMELQNSLIVYKKEKVTMFEEQFERMFLESFIYNFAVSIISSDEVDGLPDPFEVFKTLKHFVKTPLFSCDVAWMNNPVLGAAFEAFELAAKASYLFRHCDKPGTLNSAKKLLDIASFYPSPMVPPEIRESGSKYVHLKDSVILADIVMKASKIVLLKTLEPSLTEHDPELQKDVAYVVSRLKQISEDSPVWSIAAWLLFIIGIAAVEREHRDVILDSLFTAAEMVHGRGLSTVVDIIHVSWGLQSTSGVTSDSRGLDVLLDEKLLSTVFI